MIDAGCHNYKNVSITAVPDARCCPLLWAKCYCWEYVRYLVQQTIIAVTNTGPWHRNKIFPDTKILKFQDIKPCKHTAEVP